MTKATGGTSGVYESQEPVTPPESDFTYRKTPINNPTKAIITKYNGKETKVIIPETLEGLPVSSITANAFSESENLTYVKLPSTLVAVSGAAFSMCSLLESFDINSNNTTFSVIDGVLYQRDAEADEIYSLAAFPAGRGGHFTIPYGVRSVAAYAFDHCYNLTSVDMYNTVTAISNNAFSYCWNLTSIRLSDNLKSLGAGALSYCDSLSSINLPTSLTSIGKDAVLGGIDSDNNKFYYFIDGAYCTKDSYAHRYLVNQALPLSIIKLNNHSITDNDTGIRLIDAYSALPQNEIMDISVEAIELEEVASLIPTRYARAYAFDIDITKNGDSFTPEDNVIFDFTDICPDAIPSATKVYLQRGDELVLVSGSAHTPFVGAQTTQGGRFIIVENDDFSVKGDIDGDGIVTLTDVKTAMHCSTGTMSLTAEQLAAANLDNSQDGKITTEDARKILRLAGGMSIN